MQLGRIVDTGHQNLSDWIAIAVRAFAMDIWPRVDLIALTFAVAFPVFLVLSRHEIRLQRLEAIKEFIESFSSQKRRSRIDGIATNPSFEFVRAKYTTDIHLGRKSQDAFDSLAGDPIKQINFIILRARRMICVPNIQMAFASTTFGVVTYFGFTYLHRTLVCGFDSAGCPGFSSPAWRQVAVIGVLTFTGGYVAASRALLRSLAVFDISAHTFLRHSSDIIASVLFGIFIYLAFQNPFAAVGTEFSGQKAATPESVPAIWFGLAPLFGLIPQSSTKFLLVKFSSLFSWIKTTDDRFTHAAQITPLDIIDGVDYETRFRLEECGIYDVQNLATHNPIMLCIEAPFGFYRCFDWVAQAQLCHIVGLEKFLFFREFNIRTIFDLERAISSRHSPKEFDEICAGILYSETATMKEIARVSDMRLIILEDDKSRSVAPAEYMQWARQKLSAADISKATEHVMRWIGDDLHVRRLRAIWRDICYSLGPGSEQLSDNKDASREHTRWPPDIRTATQLFPDSWMTTGAGRRRW